ncbi:hypothetical protein BJX65DRAFT_138329 [Aspergillus insuetus]
MSTLYCRLFIVVDALGECQTMNNCRMKFINELISLQSRHNANIFATSRFINDAVEGFQYATLLEVRANPEDLGDFLAANMAKLPAFVRRSETIQDSVKTAILEAIDGMFLLARLYIEFLEDKMTPRAMRKALEELQRRAQGESGGDHRLQLLSEAYDQAMEKINSQREGYHRLARNALSWIVFSKKALQTSVLQDALAVELENTEFNPTNRPEVGSIVSVCAGLVAVDEESNVIRLAHYTTQEYFSQRAKDWLPDAESRIAKSCITYIRFTVRHRQHFPRIFRFSCWFHGSLSYSSLDFDTSSLPSLPSSQAGGAPELQWPQDASSASSFHNTISESGYQEDPETPVFEGDSEWGANESSDTDQSSEPDQDQSTSGEEEQFDSTENESANDGSLYGSDTPFDCWSGAQVILGFTLIEPNMTKLNSFLDGGDDKLPQLHSLAGDVLYDYAFLNWGHHARASSTDGEKFVMDFLEEDELMWEIGKYLLYPLLGLPEGIGLHIASQFGLKRSVKALLDKGACVQAKRKADWGPQVQSETDTVERRYISNVIG